MALKRQQDDDGKERLQAYDGKDYSEIIEFPVELVDRDGVVRRYSYEESLAVYHRRIQSAPWRYADDELIRAEIGHCTRRIEQIKRSYSARSRRAPTPSNPRASLGEGWEILVRHYEGALAVSFETNLRMAGITGVETLLMGDFESFEEAASRVRSVLAEDVLRVAQAYFDGDCYALASLGPESTT